MKFFLGMVFLLSTHSFAGDEILTVKQVRNELRWHVGHQLFKLPTRMQRSGYCFEFAHAGRDLRLHIRLSSKGWIGYGPYKLREGIHVPKGIGLLVKRLNSNLFSELVTFCKRLDNDTDEKLTGSLHDFNKAYAQFHRDWNSNVHALAEKIQDKLGQKFKADNKPAPLWNEILNPNADVGNDKVHKLAKASLKVWMESTLRWVKKALNTSDGRHFEKINKMGELSAEARTLSDPRDEILVHFTYWRKFPISKITSPGAKNALEKFYNQLIYGKDDSNSLQRNWHIGLNECSVAGETKRFGWTLFGKTKYQKWYDACTKTRHQYLSRLKSHLEAALRAHE